MWPGRAKTSQLAPRRSNRMLSPQSLCTGDIKRTGTTKIHVLLTAVSVLARSGQSVSQSGLCAKIGSKIYVFDRAYSSFIHSLLCHEDGSDAGAGARIA